MRSLTFLSLFAATTAARNAVPAFWDGKCYYPKPDIGFELDSYLGRWHQVAGTPEPYNAACKCTFAQYTLNVSSLLCVTTVALDSELTGSKDSGTVKVNNTCEAGSRPTSILGTATPVGPEYGAAGAFQVQFPGERPPDCPGPNYIVQGTQ